MMQMPSAMSQAKMIPACNTWQIGAPYEAGDIQSFPITVDNGDLVINIGDVTSSFEPSSIDPNATRKNLSLKLPRSWESSFELLEKELAQFAVAQSVTLFGSFCTPDELQATYKPVYKKNGTYPAELRAKLSTAGFYSTRFWSPDRTRVDPPPDFPGRSFNVCIKLRGIWVGKDRAFGLVCDATDMQEITHALGDCHAECPFD